MDCGELVGILLPGSEKGAPLAFQVPVATCQNVVGQISIPRRNVGYQKSGWDGPVESKFVVGQRPSRKAGAGVNIEALKSEHDIVQIIGASVALKKRGQRYFGICPFHADTNPSLVVYPRKQAFHCFGCLARGDIIDWIQKSLGVDFKAAIKLLGHLPEVEPQPLFKAQPKRFRSISKQAAEYWHSRLGKRRTYFYDRGFTDYTVNHERWGWDGRRFVVTIWEGKPQTSKLLAVKLRRDDAGERRRLAENGLADDLLDKAFHLIPKYVLRGSYDKILYNSHMVENQNEVWVFFGELDAALATQLGLPACSPVHGANGWVRNWGRTHLRAAKRVNIFPDRGEEDQGFRVKAMIGGQARVLSLPEGPWSDFGEFILAGQSVDELRTI